MRVSVVRITDVQAGRFTLYLHEAPNKVSSHTPEAVSYLVLEAESWELPLVSQERLAAHTSTTPGTAKSPMQDKGSFTTLRDR